MNTFAINLVKLQPNTYQIALHTAAIDLPVTQFAITYDKYGANLDFDKTISAPFEKGFVTRYILDMIHLIELTVFNEFILVNDPHQTMDVHTLSQIVHNEVTHEFVTYVIRKNEHANLLIASIKRELTRIDSDNQFQQLPAIMETIMAGRN